MLFLENNNTVLKMQKEIGNKGRKITKLYQLENDETIEQAVKTIWKLEKGENVKSLYIVEFQNLESEIYFEYEKEDD